MLRPAERVRVVTWSPLDRCPALMPLALVGLAVAVGIAVGRPPFDLHPPLHRLGVMDPACGLTRGVVAAVRGHLREAWAYNPASPAVVAGAVAVLGRHVAGRLSGAWLTIAIPRPTT